MRNSSKLRAGAAVVVISLSMIAAAVLVAQRKAPTMPEVIVLGKNSPVGAVRFDHVKHNGGEYNVDGPISCIQCHHTAQPASELARIPPHKTVWPPDRETTLSAELFAEDPVNAAATACRDCHVRPGEKPKLLPAIPIISDPEIREAKLISNRVAFHTACDSCHFNIGFRTGDGIAPSATNCSNCHKPVAKPLRPRRRSK